MHARRFALALAALSLGGCGGGGGDADAGLPDAGSCLPGIAWYIDTVPTGTAQETGGKQPNAFGLYDMLGNATEWVADCYHESYADAPADGSAWDESPCTYRVIRGGCYGTTARGLRVSAREGVEVNFYGTCAPTVRCVRAVGAPDQGVAELDWVSIPGGTFSMGCSAGDGDCQPQESPAHPVTVAAFEMTATEVDQQAYHDQTGESPSTTFCPACAVTYVTWDQAAAFCAAVGGRLPSEAEWEYAARAGTTTRYYCGDE
jgi:formylglycine-generating enzyme required for sulfatase activity